MKESLRGVVAGGCAGVVTTLLTAALAVPFLQRLLGRSSDLNWENTRAISGELDAWAVYETAGQPLADAVVWIVAGAHGMQVQFAMPGASGEASIAFGTAPWVLLAGPISCLFAGAALSRRGTGGVATTAGFVAVGYTASLHILAVSADVTANKRSIAPVLKPVSFPPWFVVVPAVALVFGSVGFLAATRWQGRRTDVESTASGTRYRRFRETAAGVGASVLAYLLTAALAGPWLPGIFGDVDDVSRETYLAVDPGAWREVAWVLLNTYGVPLSFSGPYWMGGGTDLSLGTAPWVYLAGPTACVAVGTFLARNRPDRHPAVVGGFLAVGYTVSLFVVSFTTTAVSVPYSIETDVLGSGSPVPPLAVVAAVTMLTGTFGVIVGKQSFDGSQ